MLLLEKVLAAGATLAQRGTASQWSRIAYDSRLTQPHDLFVALKSLRADGHQFINDAIAAGATAILCVQPPHHVPEHVTVLTCADVLHTLSRWASQYLHDCGSTVVAVTGSVGKTSTKRAIATLLGHEHHVFRSSRSFNSELGLSVALAGLEPEHEWAVLEFGADRHGDIQRLAHLFPPKIGVVTTVGATHLTAFETLEGVAREKSSLIQALPADGWAVLNGDDPLVLAMAQQTPAWVLTFGSGAHCDVWFSNVRYRHDGTRFDLHGHSDGELPTGAKRTGRDAWSLPIQIKTLGISGVRATVAAIATALACQIPLQTIIERISLIEPAAGRLRPLRAKGGGWLIDDSFNAAPPSMLVALDTLKALKARRRIAILGEMADLGASNAHYHEQIGKYAASIADIIITKGEHATQIARAATEEASRLGREIQITPVYTAAAAIVALPELRPDDVILVKGSAEARMERVAAGLLAPDVAPDAVLVRQEKAWRQLRIGTPDRPTTLQIDLDALAINTRILRRATNTPIMAVLKADAYGHGAIRAARTVLFNGATMLAVATLGEALNLRHADIAAPILILGYTPAWQMREAVINNITVTVFARDTVLALNDAAKSAHTTANVQIKVDTGMTRLGLPPSDIPDFVRLIHGLSNVKLDGIFTHFATADEDDYGYVATQWQRFDRLIHHLTAEGLRPPHVHAANSAAAIRFPQARYDLVRTGIALYGLDYANHPELELMPVLSFHSEIAQIHDVDAGTPVSYGCTFVTQRPSKIATIPVGYADGFRRSPYSWREVLIRGKRAPVVGRVCMDYTMIDVTDLADVTQGDPVVLIGKQGHDCITVEEVAAWLKTSNYEVVSAILPRVPREAEG